MSTESKSLKNKLNSISKVIAKNKSQLQEAHVQCRLLEARAVKASRTINKRKLRKTQRAYGKKKSKRTKRRKSKRTKKRISKATRKR